MSPATGIQGYDIDLLANSEQQVKTSFMDVHDVISAPVLPEMKNALQHNFYVTLEAITGLKTRSVLRYNTSSKRGKDSKRTGCIILDEIHEYLDFTNINTLKSGLGKRKDGRCITISTFGHVRGAVFDRQMEQNEDILAAYNPKNRVFPFICRIESEEEWKDPACWVKAIPSINDFPSLHDQIEKEVLEMSYTPEYLTEFMAKRMNFPIGNSEVEVASWDNIMATNRPLPDLEGWPCVGAIDYAKTDDFVAAVLIFLVGNDICVVQHTWVCRESRDLLAIKAPLEEWERRGDLEFVDGPEIPPEAVAEWFAAAGASFNLLAVAIDNYRWALIRSAFHAVGIGGDYGVPIKLTRPSDLMKVYPVINSAFIRHQFVWGDVPILRWYTNNVKVVNAGLNYTYGKQDRRSRKTDGFMALAHGMTLLDMLDTSSMAAGVPEPFIFNT
ncbi:MAG: terminase large subunit [Clostridiales bacterium]|nr:terminase large subunit [Clostridiales bacterium]